MECSSSISPASVAIICVSNYPLLRIQSESQRCVLNGLKHRSLEQVTRKGLINRMPNQQEIYIKSKKKKI